MVRKLLCLISLSGYRLSTTSNMDCQLSCPKSGQEFSVMKTKKTVVSRKVVCFDLHINSCFVSRLLIDENFSVDMDLIEDGT